MRAVAKSGVDLLASSDRVMLTPGSIDLRRIRTAARVRRAAVSRTSCSTCRARMRRCSTRSRPRPRIVVVVNQELATVRSAQPDCHAAAALRQDQGRCGREPRRPHSPRSATRTSSERSASRRRPQSSRATTAARCQRSTRAQPVAVDQPQRAGRSRSPALARDSLARGVRKRIAGVEQWRRVFGLFGSKRRATRRSEESEHHGFPCFAATDRRTSTSRRTEYQELKGRIHQTSCSTGSNLERLSRRQA